MKHEVFIGVETEGENQNALTVFIPRGCGTKLEELYPTLVNKFDRYYFGAGENRGFTTNDRKVMNRLASEGKQVLLEVLDLSGISHLHPGVEVVLVTNLRIHHLKIQPYNGKALEWYVLSPDKAITTQLNDIRYTLDTYLENDSN